MSSLEALLFEIKIIVKLSLSYNVLIWSADIGKTTLFLEYVVSL